MRIVSWLVAGPALLWAAGAAFANGPIPEHILERVHPARRSEVREILADPTFVRTLRLETAADPRVFTFLLDHPEVNTSIGRALVIAPHRLVRVGPGRYQGDDGAGNTGTLEVLWAEGDRRVLMERGVSPGWWFGDIAGRVVAVVELAREGDRIRGNVEVWARIDQGLVDRLLRLLAPVLGGFLDRKLHEQFGITFQVAERAAREPQRFCHLLAGLSDGSLEERQALAGLAGCPAGLGGVHSRGDPLDGGMLRHDGRGYRTFVRPTRNRSGGSREEAGLSIDMRHGLHQGPFHIGVRRTIFPPVSPRGWHAACVS